MDLGSPFGVLDIWWVVTPKGTPSECTLSIGYIPLVCSKTFPVGSAVSGFWIRLRYKNLLNFFYDSRVWCPYIYGCHRDIGDALYFTGVMVYG